jgi:stearoyl-CoA desaturase (delta-9 desaturase)
MKSRLFYHTAIQFVSFIGLLYAVFFAAAPLWWWGVSLVICFILAVYGMSIAYHHGVCHGTFRFSRPIQLLLYWVGMQATLHPPRSWAIAHYAHHVYVDTEHDPHSPKHKGWKIWFFWNHIVTKYERKHALVFKELFRDKAVDWLETPIGYWTVILSLPLLAFMMAGVNGLVFMWLIPNAYMIATSLVFTFAHDDKTGAVKSPWLHMFSFGDGDHKQHHDKWNHVGKLHVFCANLIGNRNGVHV